MTPVQTIQASARSELVFDGERSSSMQSCGEEGAHSWLGCAELTQLLVEPGLEVSLL